MKRPKEIWCVVPFSRPEFLQNVIDNFKRQSYQKKKLLIVENGNGINCCKNNDFSPDVLLSSDAHQAYAKSTALEWLKNHGKDFWTTWDDDDYYSSDYLSELYLAANKATVIGKSSIFFKSKEDKIYLLGSAFENSNTEFLHGPTISAWVSESVYFQNVGVAAEDTVFIMEMMNKGCKFYSTSKNYFLYKRHNRVNHTWPVSDYQIIQGWLNTKKDSYVNNYFCSVLDAESLLITNKSLFPFDKIRKEELSPYDYSTYLNERESVGDMGDWVQSVVNRLGLDAP